MGTECTHKGSSMDEIYRGLNPWELSQLPPIINKRDHAVLFQLPINLNSNEPPEPHRGEVKWDSNHVRLPCASQNEYLLTDEVNSSLNFLSELLKKCEFHFQNDPDVTIKKKRWEIIQTALLRPIRTSRELEKAILSYNTKYAKRWKFHALHELFEDVSDIISFKNYSFNITLSSRNWMKTKRPHFLKKHYPRSFV